MMGVSKSPRGFEAGDLEALINRVRSIPVDKVFVVDDHDLRYVIESLRGAET